MGVMARPSFLGNKYWCSQENGTLEEYKLAPEGVNQALLAGELFQKISSSLYLAIVDRRESPFDCEKPQESLKERLVHVDGRETNYVQELEENKIPLENVRICYSPFSRTRHTAKVVASVLNIPFEGPQCKMIEDLRERFFGPSFELTSHDKYSEIWALDAKDPFMKPEGGESVADVVSRLTSALITIESEFQGCTILVVSHGDPLQILQTILNAAKEHTGPNVDDLASRIQAVKVPSVLSLHRKFSLLTGELRAVI
ncbi:unnamed protein product [Camellia sinensis]